jgi:hypothetical protein
MFFALSSSHYSKLAKNIFNQETDASGTVQELPYVHQS